MRSIFLIIITLVLASTYCQNSEAKTTKYNLKSSVKSQEVNKKNPKSVNTKKAKKVKKTKAKKTTSKKKVTKEKKTVTTPEVEVPSVGAVEKTRIIW